MLTTDVHVQNHCRSLVWGLVVLPWIAGFLPSARADVVITPAPRGEPLSSLYKVSAEDRLCPVYNARVAPADTSRRHRAMDDKKNSADYYEMAAFTTFDMDAPARIAVSCPEPITAARILPSSLKIVPDIKEGTLSFTLEKPGPITIEVNGRWVDALHIFANPREAAPPDPDDPNVVYYGPGIHEVTHRQLGDNQTLYLAPGAIVRAVVADDERYSISEYSGQRNYEPTFLLRGKNIRVRGRGILDGSACPTHARSPLFVDGSEISIEGVIIRDSSIWTIPIRRSSDVTVENVKLIGYRANSDGIDICNSQQVTVRDCFIRTLDDLVVVKSDQGQGPTRNIRVERCTLWNEVAHALSVGAELREEVDFVEFQDCDVIHDKGREWTLRVFHADSAPVSNIFFTNIRVEESQRLASLWIGKAVWSRDDERGHIRNVAFQRIDAAGDPLRIELTGFDAEHTVEGVRFQNVRLNGRPITGADVTETNVHVRDVTIEP